MGVSPSSPAELAGVKVDDLILKIEDQEIRLLSMQDVGVMLEHAATSGCICMTILRLRAAPAAMTAETECAKAKDGPLTVAPPTPMATPSPSPQRAQPAVSVMNYITGEKRTDTLISKTAMVHILATPIRHTRLSAATCYIVFELSLCFL